MRLDALSGSRGTTPRRLGGQRDAKYDRELSVCSTRVLRSLIGIHLALLPAAQGVRRAQHRATGNRSHISLEFAKHHVGRCHIIRPIGTVKNTTQASVSFIVR